MRDMQEGHQETGGMQSDRDKHKEQMGCMQSGAHLRPRTVARWGRCGRMARREKGVDRGDTTRSWNTPVNALRSAPICSSYRTTAAPAACRQD
jgi:hypothetical protein